MNVKLTSGPAARFLLALYSVGLAAAVLLAAPWWLAGLRPGGKYREGLAERLGRIPRARLRAPRPGQQIVWVHAVSVGEVLAAAVLIAELRAALPGGLVYISTTTRTGQAVARARFGAESVFYFPLDFAFAVRAWLRFLKPSLLVLVESEFWPRLLCEARRASIPAAVVNGRLSSRSWPHYRRLRALWRPLLRTLALAAAQSADDADRLRYLGAERVEVAGNLKFDFAPPAEIELVAKLRSALPPGVPVLVCGSTLAGEEELLLRALPSEPVVIVAPRHPERFDEVAVLLAKGSREWVRLSSWRRSPKPISAGAVLLMDSVGELASVYALATLAIVGGGFLHEGGHNPLEPAAFGKPVIIGTRFTNFTDVVLLLVQADAVILCDRFQLSEQIKLLLQNPQVAEAIGRRARQVCIDQAGATARTLAALLPLVTPSQARQ